MRGAEGGTDETGSAVTAELLALVDRLEELLVRSELSELEVESGGTALVLRMPGAIALPSDAAVVLGTVSATGAQRSAAADPAGELEDASTRHAVLAPLTGVFYEAPSPDAAPYVRVGGDVQVGQVIGLIEAMKLFNEIKSDIAGKVTRVVARSGDLVKAKQPLIEVEPS